MAVLQIELNRPRVKSFDTDTTGSYDHTSSNTMIVEILCRALRDTIRNGGTFVAVVSDTTITAIQHEDVKPLEAE